MRKPRGYEGQAHETIGSDILAVRHALTALAGNDSTALRLIGPLASARLVTVQSNGWYPIEWLLDMMERIDERIGRFALLKLGRTLFKLSHQARIAEVATCGRDIVYGIDGMYHHANRGGDIGGWTVRSFDPNLAVLEKTTPHHCMMEEGILSQALSAVGSPAVISQTQCFRDGADACRFSIVPAMQSAQWQPPRAPWDTDAR
ncbi:MAG TPA: hypothetical protein VG755_08440 [Nannocystaceae bacterium]|nr:hypothetical protein [Nannocystaceae bacterium]